MAPEASGQAVSPRPTSRLQRRNGEGQTAVAERARRPGRLKGLPQPTTAFRRARGSQFQRALDPLRRRRPLRHRGGAERARERAPRARAARGSRTGPATPSSRSRRAGSAGTRRAASGRAAPPAARSAASIASAVNGSTLASARSAASSSARRRTGRPSSYDVVEEEPGERGKVAELLDLLLHERRRLVHQLRVPVVALLAEVQQRARARTRPAGARAGRRRSSSRASGSRTRRGWTARARGRSARPARRAT